MLLINTLAGTMGRYTTKQVEDYLRQVIVSRFNDYLGEHLRSLFDLPGRFDEIAVGLKRVLEVDFTRFGLALDGLYVTSITPPEEVQQAIDDRSRLSVIKEMDNFVRMKAAMAMEKAAIGTGEAGAGLGAGHDDAGPARQPAGHARPSGCHDRRGFAGPLRRVQQRHPGRGPLLPLEVAFCPRCGHPADEHCGEVLCPGCHGANLPGAIYCNQCGDKLI